MRFMGGFEAFIKITTAFLISSRGSDGGNIFLSVWQTIFSFFCRAVVLVLIMLIGRLHVAIVRMHLIGCR